MKAASFLTLNVFPVYGGERHSSSGEIIGYNAAEYTTPNNYSVERSFIKMDITVVGDSKFQEDPENVDGFHFKLISNDHFITEVITTLCKYNMNKNDLLLTTLDIEKV